VNRVAVLLLSFQLVRSLETLQLGFEPDSYGSVAEHATVFAKDVPQLIYLKFPAKYRMQPGLLRMACM